MHHETLALFLAQPSRIVGLRLDHRPALTRAFPLVERDNLAPADDRPAG
jgi:hypothetical protein